MIDIQFYQKSYKLLQKIEKGKYNFHKHKDILFDKLEKLRSAVPIIYNIETTNACNMKCKMCPRTTQMTRKVETLKMVDFKKALECIEPWTEKQWNNWKKFVEKTYRIKETDMSENHFFLYIIPKVIQLHGYGDPLLDSNMHEYIQMLTEKGVHSYFSCNPANIDLDRTELMFKAGLSYIKYSIESVDDKKHKKIRGSKSNFSESYKKICKLLELKKEKGYKTTIIITMLDLNDKDQTEEFAKLKEAFKDKDVYIYLKSEDQQWYRKDYHGTNSVHWSEICKHPWLSTTVKSNGEIAMCMEDFDNEIILGNLKDQSIFEIWEGLAYHKFRLEHFKNNSCLKCHKRCDMKLIGDYL